MAFRQVVVPRMTYSCIRQRIGEEFRRPASGIPHGGEFVHCYVTCGQDEVAVQSLVEGFEW